MKLKLLAHPKRLVLVVLFNLFASLFIIAQNTYALRSVNMKILGSSTIHDWTVLVSKASGTGTITLESNKLKDINALQLIIPVKELKSEKKSSKMDEKIYESLKAKSFADISFKLSRIVALPTGSNDISLTAVGIITIAGVSREETLKVQAKVMENRLVSFSGSLKIKMTNYKIKPPTAMMGMMTTGDDVTINFDCTMIKNN